MKKTILAMIAFAAATTSAFASETERTRLYRFDFDCGFNNEVNCSANAQIVAPGDRHRDRNTDELNRKNLLSVTCGGKLAYAGAAALESDRHVVKITPPGRHSPAIIIPRHDRDFSAEWMTYRSFLRIRHDKIPGECRVRAVPLHHDDEIVINSGEVSELE